MDWRPYPNQWIEPHMKHWNPHFYTAYVRQERRMEGLELEMEDELQRTIFDGGEIVHVMPSEKEYVEADRLGIDVYELRKRGAVSVSDPNTSTKHATTVPARTDA